MTTWQETKKGLFKKFIFKNELELKNFVLKVEKLSDEINHHADFNVVRTNELEIYCITHDLNAISQKDYDLAKNIDLI
jgi:pterin-4a-carbinolamine dehydratase